MFVCKVTLRGAKVDWRRTVIIPKYQEVLNLLFEENSSRSLPLLSLFPFQFFSSSFSLFHCTCSLFRHAFSTTGLVEFQAGQIFSCCPGAGKGISIGTIIITIQPQCNNSKQNLWNGRRGRRMEEEEEEEWNVH